MNLNINLPLFFVMTSQCAYMSTDNQPASRALKSGFHLKNRKEQRANEEEHESFLSPLNAKFITAHCYFLFGHT